MFNEKIRGLFAGRLQRVAQYVQDTDEIQSVIGKLRVDTVLTLKDLCIIKSAVETQPGEEERTTDRLLEALKEPIREQYKEEIERIHRLTIDLDKVSGVAFVFDEGEQIYTINEVRKLLMEVYTELSEVQV